MRLSLLKLLSQARLEFGMLFHADQPVMAREVMSVESMHHSEMSWYIVKPFNLFVRLCPLKAAPLIPDEPVHAAFPSQPEQAID